MYNKAMNATGILIALQHRSSEAQQFWLIQQDVDLIH